MTAIDDRSALLERQRQALQNIPRRSPPPREDEPEVTTWYELPFAQIDGFRPLVLDLHVPRRGGPHPVVVWLHGGGWRRGSRSQGRAHELARRGFAVAAVDYRLSGEARFPAPLHDVKAAVRWLRANAGSYGLDPTRLAVWGASAGAHLAMVLALTPGNAALDGAVGGNLEQPVDVQAVVDFFGPAFFALDPPTGPAEPGPEQGLLGFAPWERPDEARQAMPLSYVHPGAPPFLIMHGDVDPMVPHDRSRTLHDALTAAGAESTLVTVPGAVHEDAAFWAPEAQERILAFLRRALGVQAQ